MHQSDTRVAPEWDSSWWQKLLLEVANRLELPLSLSRGKDVACNKKQGGHEVGLKQGEEDSGTKAKITLSCKQISGEKK